MRCVLRAGRRRRRGPARRKCLVCGVGPRRPAARLLAPCVIPVTNSISRRLPDAWPCAARDMATHHDSLFKAVFSDPAEARSELRAMLPRELALRIDWSTLRRRPESLLDPGNAERRADLLFEVELSNRPLLLHLLLEHKSGADRWTPLQTLGYTVRLWEAHRRRAPRSRWLPPVITVVVHHGRRGWTGTTDVFDLVELEDDLRPHVRALMPHTGFVVDDLNMASDTEIAARGLLSGVTFCRPAQAPRRQVLPVRHAHQRPAQRDRARPLMPLVPHQAQAVALVLPQSGPQRRLAQQRRARRIASGAKARGPASTCDSPVFAMLCRIVKTSRCAGATRT